MKLQAFEVLALHHPETVDAPDPTLVGVKVKDNKTEVIPPGIKLIIAKDKESAEREFIRAIPKKYSFDNVQIIVRPFQ